MACRPQSVLWTWRRSKFSSSRDWLRIQGVVLLFSMTSRASYQTALKCFERIRIAKGGRPFAAVLAADQCEKAASRVVTRVEAQSRAQQWGTPYYELSVKQNFHVSEPCFDLVRLIRHASAVGRATSMFTTERDGLSKLKFKQRRHTEDHFDRTRRRLHEELNRHLGTLEAGVAAEVEPLRPERSAKPEEKERINSRLAAKEAELEEERARLSSLSMKNENLRRKLSHPAPALWGRSIENKEEEDLSDVVRPKREMGGAGASGDAPNEVLKEPEEPGLVVDKGGGMEVCSVKVCVRFRPVNSTERRLGTKSTLQLDCNRTGVRLRRQKGREATDRQFEFDSVLSPAASQENMYKAVAAPIVEDALNGYNGTVFAYGQTGSGKTYSMFGEGLKSAKAGVIPRCARRLFEFVEAVKKGEETGMKSVEVKAAVLEIYREKVRYLLAKADEAPPHPHKPFKGRLVGVTKRVVQNEEELLKLVATGQARRTVRATALNAYSSRSHSLFTLTVTEVLEDDTIQRAKLHLADLAGSERVDKSALAGITLKEAKEINKSLSALGNCILALSRRARMGRKATARRGSLKGGLEALGHVPFRDSKLTFILKDSLGGNRKTALLVTASSHASCFDETVSSLKFGARAKDIRNTVSQNASDAATVNELQKEVARLRKKLKSSYGMIDQLQNLPQRRSKSPQADAQPNSEDPKRMSRSKSVSSLGMLAGRLQKKPWCVTANCSCGALVHTLSDAGNTPSQLLYNAKSARKVARALEHAAMCSKHSAAGTVVMPSEVIANLAHAIARFGLKKRMSNELMPNMEPESPSTPEAPPSLPRTNTEQLLRSAMKQKRQRVRVEEHKRVRLVVAEPEEKEEEKEEEEYEGNYGDFLEGGEEEEEDFEKTAELLSVGATGPLARLKTRDVFSRVKTAAKQLGAGAEPAPLVISVSSPNMTARPKLTQQRSYFARRRKRKSQGAGESEDEYEKEEEEEEEEKEEEEEEEEEKRSALSVRRNVKQVQQRSLSLISKPDQDAVFSEEEKEEKEEEPPHANVFEEETEEEPPHADVFEEEEEESESEEEEEEEEEGVSCHLLLVDALSGTEQTLGSILVESESTLLVDVRVEIEAAMAPVLQGGRQRSPSPSCSVETRSRRSRWGGEARERLMGEHESERCIQDIAGRFGGDLSISLQLRRVCPLP